MNFLEELRWRGMLQDITPGLEEELSKGMKVGYIGFDPTAPALTIGNYVQIMLLTLFQKSGHKPIVLMGGATGRIGDPSGKDKERELKSFDVLDGNLASQAEMIAQFLDFEQGENKAELVNNISFYEKMNALDFLRDVGKTLTVNYMSQKESVKKRIETGISFTEFSYQLLQGYDYQCLYEQKNCIVQMGGSDQWGNITTGTEFIRRNVGGKAYAVTTPLLTKADGSKFGKSTKGNIWLHPEYTSPYEFYQFWLRCNDADLPKFIRYFTLKSKEEVEALEAEYATNPNALKKILADELTLRIHGQEALDAVQNVSNLLFKKVDKATLLSFDTQSLATVAGEIVSHVIQKEDLTKGINIIDLVTDAKIFKSNGEARRAIKGKALAVNKDKVNSHEETIQAEALLHDKYILIENGKKHKFMIIAK